MKKKTWLYSTIRYLLYGIVCMVLLLALSLSLERITSYILQVMCGSIIRHVVVQGVGRPAMATPFNGD